VNRYIFDVDGTLTPSRGFIDHKFKYWFLDFVYSNNVYLITGSDYPKTEEQLGTVLCNAVERVYNCSGNDVWENGRNVRTDDWKLPVSARTWLEDKLEESSFSLRTGLHIEERPGMINFSVVGRNATHDERKLYVEYDQAHNERDTIADLFKLEFPTLDARPGGETGIDIAPVGKDKSQIVNDFDYNDVLYFFGDRMDKFGNDYPLKKVIIENDLGFAYQVTGWQDTWEKLDAHHVNRP
jgi:phosphomannomutase